MSKKIQASCPECDGDGCSYCDPEIVDAENNHGQKPLASEVAPGECGCDESVGYICGTHAKEKLSQQLLPCPFCGSDVKLDNLVAADDFFVSCGKCEVQQIANYSPEAAIARWNKRSSFIAKKLDTPCEPQGAEAPAGIYLDLSYFRHALLGVTDAFLCTCTAGSDDGPCASCAANHALSLVERAIKKSAAAPRPQEPEVEHSGYFFPGDLKPVELRPQEPRCPTCSSVMEESLQSGEVICRESLHFFKFQRLSDFAQFFSPAQSQGAAPLCGECGAILTPTGLTRPGQPRFQCLSCGATTSCTEGDDKNAKS